MRFGMVGLDNSHCGIFTAMLNDPAAPYHVPGGQVVAGYPGGSQQFSRSRDRVEGFTRELAEKHGVRLYDSPQDLAAAVDAIFITSCDGRQHLEQFRRVAVGKPVFVDKPLATTSAEAAEMFRIADDTGTPLMSCSSLRYARGVADLVPPGERVLACEAWGHAPLLDDFPGLFWYGVHSAEVLFSLMGAGCVRVRCAATAQADVVVGEWADGRTGVVRGTRVGETAAFGCVVHTAAAALSGSAQPDPPYYFLLLQSILAFCESRVSPVARAEMFGIVAFLEAAERSRAADGAAVDLNLGQQAGHSPNSTAS